MPDPERGSDMDLLWWLVQMGRQDREQFRVLREALWAMAANARKKGRSRRSVKPSNTS